MAAPTVHKPSKALRAAVFANLQLLGLKVCSARQSRVCPLPYREEIWLHLRMRRWVASP